MRTSTILATSLLLASSASALSAQTQTVEFEVLAISEIALTGTPVLTVNAATAGNAPEEAIDGGFWAITTNEADRKVTAQLDFVMPSGLTLSVNLDAPTGGTSAGDVVLTASAADVVSEISTLNESGLGVEYKLSATSAAGVVASDERVVTYTIATGA